MGKRVAKKTSQEQPAVQVAADKVLVLRTCRSDMTSHGGFCWPTSGAVEAKDWSPVAECGSGLHGLLWGEGDGGLLNWETDAKWLVVEVPRTSVVDLDGKVKFPRGEVIHCGDRKSATEYLAARAPGRAIVGGTATAGSRGTATAGDAGTATAGYAGTATAGYAGTATAGDAGTATAGSRGTATAGDAGTATAGYAGTATAGDAGTATAGYAGTATAGSRGTATAGDEGTATAGYAGTATAGYAGTATAGSRGTATAGDEGILVLRWWDGKRYRIATFYVGEDGIEPNQPYKLDEHGKPVKVDKPKKAAADAA